MNAAATASPAQPAGGSSELEGEVRPVGLGWMSGAGLVVANMIGAGVLLSTGFMAQKLGPGSIMAAWALGAVLALLGALTYGSIASMSGRSGGEYRYLSDYLHPYLGYLAGWGSLVLGFAAPIAVDALAVGEFVRVLVPLPVVGTAAASVIVISLLHAFDLDVSRRSQNALVAVKLALLLGLVAAGLALGSNAWPTWTPPNPAPDAPYETFFLQQYWIAFAFSGWNAAAYVAGEFRNPRRDVARALWAGCTLVGVLYLALNWVFVANLGPEESSVVLDYQTRHATLAHQLLENLVGPVGATIAAVVIVIAFLSAMSAMTFVGPRVYSAMAADGFLPRALRARSGRPPLWCILLQGSIALAFVLTHDIREAVETAAAVLILFSGLTALCAVRLSAGSDPARPSKAVAAAAVVFAGFNGWLLFLGVTRFGQLGWELGAIGLVAALFYALGRRRARVRASDLR